MAEFGLCRSFLTIIILKTLNTHTRVHKHMHVCVCVCVCVCESLYQGKVYQKITTRLKA